MHTFLRKRSSHSLQSGYGTVQLLLLLGLMVGVLMLFVPSGPISGENPRKVKIRICKVQMAMFEGGLDSFRQDVGRYPTTEEGLEALFQRPHITERWLGPHIPKNAPPDAWGRPFVYHSPSEDKASPYELYSAGENGIDENGRGDDVSDQDETLWNTLTSMFRHS